MSTCQIYPRQSLANLSTRICLAEKRLSMPIYDPCLNFLDV